MNRFDKKFYDNLELSECIKTFCDQNKINEADFAELVGIHPTTLSRIKAGKHCSPRNLQKLTAFLGESTKRFIKDVDEPTKREIEAALNSTKLSQFAKLA